VLLEKRKDPNRHSYWKHQRCLWMLNRAKRRRLVFVYPLRLYCSYRRCWATLMDEPPLSRSIEMRFVEFLSHPWWLNSKLRFSFTLCCSVFSFDLIFPLLLLLFFFSFLFVLDTNTKVVLFFYTGPSISVQTKLGLWLQAHTNYLYRKTFPFATLWITRTPYEMTKIPFSGLSCGCRKHE
jgi:hypothetical protein